MGKTVQKIREGILRHRNDEFIHIDKADPVRLFTKTAYTVFVSGSLSVIRCPGQEGYSSGGDIWFKNIPVIVRRVVVIEIEMIYADQQMILKPFLQVGSLILENLADRNMILSFCFTFRRNEAYIKL